MTDSPKLEAHTLMRKHAHTIMTAVPWARTLGFELVSIDKAKAMGKVAWREDLVGDPETGVIAGGVLTALLDNLCGVAVGAALTEFKSMATLDLRIDYMRPATKGEDVLAEAECYHITRSIAFCRATAFHGEAQNRIIATATATFALNDPSRWAGGGIQRAVEAEGLKP
ncbi:MAG: PaaI family thioesterase [Pseudomonadota bacterium]